MAMLREELAADGSGVGAMVRALRSTVLNAISVFVAPGARPMPPTQTGGAMDAGVGAKNHDGHTSMPRRAQDQLSELHPRHP
eukprot:1508746-Prymnesium_polylepis.1